MTNYFYASIYFNIRLHRFIIDNTKTKKQLLVDGISRLNENQNALLNTQNKNFLVVENGIMFASQDRVGAAAASAIMGNVGVLLMAGLIMVSTFGCNNGLILAGARVYYTMAQDGLFFKKAGTLNKNAVPAWALWAQCIVAGLLCLSGKYGDLLTMVSFIVVIFYVLTIIGIFILRKKEPNLHRPYKAFGYPVLPAIYIVMATVFCIGLVYTKPFYSLWGLVITLMGIPLYYIALRNQKAA